MNLLALRAPLLERLRTALPPAVQVLTAVNLGALIYGTQVAPAVYLIYLGGTVAESRPDGLAVRIEQTWQAVVCARNVGAQQSGAPAQDEAGALAGAVLDALVGCVLEGSSKPLKLAAMPYGGDNPEATAQLLPLSFAAEITYRSPS
jgi:hypothetical protein